MGDLRKRMRHDAELGCLLDGDRRYVLMRADVLMGIVRAVPERLRDEVLAAMLASTADGGGRSARAYYDYVGRDPLRLLGVMVDSASDLGWGRWSFDPVTETGLTLHVRSSPFAAGYGAADRPICAPIAGMLQSVGSLIFAESVRVVESRCEAMGHEACQFNIIREPEK